MSLPARLHGWGLRSLEANCGPAYLGTLETAIPYMAGLSKVCPQMEQVWGGEDCWGEGADEKNRWRKVLESGCREGREMRRAWVKISTEAQSCMNFLEEEMPEALATPLPGLGNGSLNGSTRSRVVEAREQMQAKVLNKVLEGVRPKSTRAAWVWRQQDKVSSAWLLCLPVHGTKLSNAEFSEAAATKLCLESPACKGRVGEPIRGRALIDKYGDNIQAAALPGDHWRTRHNSMLHHLHNACMWAGLPCELEVHNLFAGVMHQQGLSRAEQMRQYQGIVPDMRITLPGVGERAGGEGVGAPGLPAGGLAGQSSPVLHELKVISSSRTWYKPTQAKRAVDGRADLLQGEYERKARAADRRQGVPEGVVGRVEQKLVSLGKIAGIVVGNFGEVSEATHSLLAALATSRVRVAGVTRGKRGYWKTEEGERAVAISSLRRRLSVMAVKCQASSLLGRLETLGPGGTAALRRRQQAAGIERAWQEENRAQLQATRDGFRGLRSGFAKLD